MMVGDAAPRIRILYGGSVTGANAGTILAIDNVDGALVGGAAIRAGVVAQGVAGRRGLPAVQDSLGAQHRNGLFDALGRVEGLHL